VNTEHKDVLPHAPSPTITSFLETFGVSFSRNRNSRKLTDSHKGSRGERSYFLPSNCVLGQTRLTSSGQRHLTHQPTSPVRGSRKQAKSPSLPDSQLRNEMPQTGSGTPSQVLPLGVTGLKCACRWLNALSRERGGCPLCLVSGAWTDRLGRSKGKATPRL
jgi:hypothetical protein